MPCFIDVVACGTDDPDSGYDYRRFSTTFLQLVFLRVRRKNANWVRIVPVYLLHITRNDAGGCTLLYF